MDRREHGMTLATVGLSFVLAAILAQFGSIAAVLMREKRVARRVARWRPPITILRPVCGMENHIEETLGSTFRIDYPEFEIVFCVASSADPVVPLVERLMAAHPQIPARLLVGDDRISINPKLNNLVKGWAAARHEFVAMADSNLLLPPDYLDLLMARWDEETGLVSSPAFGGRPGNAAAELECAFLNSYQARWQLAADAAGFGFAQGKTLFCRRALIDGAGGIRALARQPAEDAAATKLVRDARLKVRLVARPFEQPLGRRGLAEVWRRQLRWARLRRDTFGTLFALEILSGGFAPLTGLAALAAVDAAPWFGLAAVFLAWYGAEIALCRASGWPVSARTPMLLVARDLMLPLLWLAAWAGNSFVWRGNAMDISRGEAESPEMLTARFGFTPGRAMLRWIRRC